MENKRDRESWGFGAEEVEVILAEAEEAARNPTRGCEETEV